MLPDSEFEVWSAAKSPSLRFERKAIVDGAKRETRVLRVGNARAAKSQAQSLRGEGFDVVSLQFSL